MELLFAFTMHSQGSGAMIHPIISHVEYMDVLPLIIILDEYSKCWPTVQVC